MKELIRVLIDVALECLVKLPHRIFLKEKSEKEEDLKVEDIEDFDDDGWTEDECIKIFMSVVKILQINFPLYKVHKLYSAVSEVIFSLD